MLISTPFAHLIVASRHGKDRLLVASGPVSHVPGPHPHAIHSLHIALHPRVEIDQAGTLMISLMPCTADVVHRRDAKRFSQRRILLHGVQ